MGDKRNSRFENTTAGVGVRRSRFRFRRAYAAVAVLTATGLLAACGSDDAEHADGTDGRDITDGTMIDSPGADTQGSGSGTGSGDFAGWANIDEAKAALKGIGVSCGINEVNENGESAGCSPGFAYVLFPTDQDSYMSELERNIAALPNEFRMQVVVGENWMMGCEEGASESEDFVPCENTAEFTGIQPQWLSSL